MPIKKLGMFSYFLIFLRIFSHKMKKRKEKEGWGEGHYLFFPWIEDLSKSSPCSDFHDFFFKKKKRYARG